MVGIVGMTCASGRGRLPFFRAHVLVFSGLHYYTHTTRVTRTTSHLVSRITSHIILHNHDGVDLNCQFDP